VKKTMMVNFFMGDKMTWPPTWWHFLELASPEEEFLVRPQEAGEAQLNSNILLPFILLQHIHHLPHMTMSWPSILDRPEAFSTVV
jgi:hypothetical protein